MEEQLTKIMVPKTKPQDSTQKFGESFIHIDPESMPQTPLGGCWFSSLRPEPPHFFRAFSALM